MNAPVTPDFYPGHYPPIAPNESLDALLNRLERQRRREIFDRLGCELDNMDYESPGDRGEGR